MVGDQGQIYTIEGVVAAILLVTTAYIILSSTYILTPGDTHISDMQLQQLGDDVLRMMDTPIVYNTSANTMYEKKMSDLEYFITEYFANSSNSSYSTLFQQEFFSYAGENDTSIPPLHMEANISNWTGSSVFNEPFLNSKVPKTNREHSVTVTRWVNLEDQVVLLEVRLWRD